MSSELLMTLAWEWEAVQGVIKLQLATPILDLWYAVNLKAVVLLHPQFIDQNECPRWLNLCPQKEG